MDPVSMGTLFFRSSLAPRRRARSFTRERRPVGEFAQREAPPLLRVDVYDDDVVRAPSVTVAAICRPSGAQHGSS